MSSLISSTQPPRLFGLRYRTIFLVLQFVNAVRFYTCPDELNFKMPHFTHVTMIVILLANAGAFFHGLDGSKQNWEFVQNCMVIVGGVYMFNVTVCLYYAYRSNGKSEDSWFFVWDQLLHWHEAFVTSAMWTLARAETRYYEIVELLEKTAAEYNSPRPKKQRRRPQKSNAEHNEQEPGDRESRATTTRKYYH